jgi:hypothetical protein
MIVVGRRLIGATRVAEASEGEGNGKGGWH